MGLASTTLPMQKSAEESGEDEDAPVGTDRAAGRRIEQRQFRAFLKLGTWRPPETAADSSAASRLTNHSVLGSRSIHREQPFCPTAASCTGLCPVLNLPARKPEELYARRLDRLRRFSEGVCRRRPSEPCL